MTFVEKKLQPGPRYVRGFLKDGTAVTVDTLRRNGEVVTFAGAVVGVVVPELPCTHCGRTDNPRSDEEVKTSSCLSCRRPLACSKA